MEFLFVKNSQVRHENLSQIYPGEIITINFFYNIKFLFLGLQSKISVCLDFHIFKNSKVSKYFKLFEKFFHIYMLYLCSVLININSFQINNYNVSNIFNCLN